MQGCTHAHAHAHVLSDSTMGHDTYNDAPSCTVDCCYTWLEMFAANTWMMNDGYVCSVFNNLCVNVCVCVCEGGNCLLYASVVL